MTIRSDDERLDCCSVDEEVSDSPVVDLRGRASYEGRVRKRQIGARSKEARDTRASREKEGGLDAYLKKGEEGPVAITEVEISSRDIHSRIRPVDDDLRGRLRVKGAGRVKRRKGSQLCC